MKRNLIVPAYALIAVMSATFTGCGAKVDVQAQQDPPPSLPTDAKLKLGEDGKSGLNVADFNEAPASVEHGKLFKLEAATSNEYVVSSTARLTTAQGCNHNEIHSQIYFAEMLADGSKSTPQLLELGSEFKVEAAHKYGVLVFPKAPASCYPLSIQFSLSQKN